MGVEGTALASFMVPERMWSMSGMWSSVEAVHISKVGGACARVGTCQKWTTKQILEAVLESFSPPFCSNIMQLATVCQHNTYTEH